MGEVVRGQISDRPWGLTFGQFGLRAVSGQLTVHGADGRDYRVAFAHGQIVGATSPLASDAATRIALTTGLISSSQAPTVAKQIAATPEIDEIALLASACRLDPTKVQLLRKRVLVQRAARTFSVEQGTFLLDDEVTIPVAMDADVDIRAVIYHGARMNLTETRLATELRGLGSHFMLGKTALESAERFGLDALEWPIIDALRERTTLPELEARHRDLDPRNVQSVIYALVACRECTVEQADFATPRTTSNEPISVSFKPTRSGANALPRPATGTVDVTPRAAPTPIRDAPSGTSNPAISIPRTRTPVPPPTPYGDDVGVPRASATGSQNAVPHPSATGSQNAVPPVRPRTAMPSAAPPTRSKPLSPAPAPARTKTLSPSPPLVARTTSTNPAVARTTSSNPVVARTSSASGSFSMPRTISQNPTGAPTEVVREYSEGSDRARQALSQAGEAFKLGQAALRENQIQLALVHLSNASTLNPHEFDYSAVLAFCQFVTAAPGDRTKTADKVRKMLNHAIQKSTDPEQARFYLGQVEQLLGHTKEALVHYQAILRAIPDHDQALTAIQAIEEKAPEKSGFSLFRKK